MSTFCEPDRRKFRRNMVRSKTARNLAWNPRSAHAATFEETDPSGALALGGTPTILPGDALPARG